MVDLTRATAILLDRAQGGEAEEALSEAEVLLRMPTGDPADGPAGLHFVRVLAHHMLGDMAASHAAVDVMVAAAERDRNWGWLAAALATRSSHRLKLGEIDGADYELDEVLRDMVDADRLAVLETEPTAAVNGRVATAITFLELRLYEMVEPHFQAAYQISTAHPELDATRTMWLTNLAELHLHWALELYQVGQDAAAESHTLQAEQYAVRAAAEAHERAAGVWCEYALLAAACAKADRHDPASAAAEIELYLSLLEERGMSAMMLSFSRPFHAVALRRSGRPAEALTVSERAVTDLPPDAGLLITAATHRTHAVLLAAEGSVEAQAGLAYGDTLAAALWKQRQRTLQSVRMMQTLETLRRQHEQATKAAEIDALTGLANRRGFDRALADAAGRPGSPVTVLLIDTDKFKQINDTRGHAAGDKVLQEVARALSTQVSAHDVVARLGGDEFAVLLPEVGSSTAREVATRMLQAVRAIPDCLVTLSIGLARGPAAGLDVLVHRADTAMYQAKRRGGDSVQECPGDVATLAA